MCTCWFSSSGTYSDLGRFPLPPLPFFADDDDEGEGFLKKEEKNPFFLPGDPNSCDGGVEGEEIAAASSPIDWKFA